MAFRELKCQSNLSSIIGSRTLTARDMVPEGFDNIPNAPPQEQVIQGGRYLVVDQSANQRKQSQISKIWRYGKELFLANFVLS